MASHIRPVGIQHFFLSLAPYFRLMSRLYPTFEMNMLFIDSFRSCVNQFSSPLLYMYTYTVYIYIYIYIYRPCFECFDSTSPYFSNVFVKFHPFQQKKWVVWVWFVVWIPGIPFPEWDENYLGYVP